jgi:aconitate hydratase
MGVLPLELIDGATRQSIGLAGFETFTIDGLGDTMMPRANLSVRAVSIDGTVKTFVARCRIDTPAEMEYYRHGGILPYVLRSLVRA